MLSSDCGKPDRELVQFGGMQEQRSLVYPREKRDLSEVTDPFRGESGWEAHGVQTSLALTYSC